MIRRPLALACGAALALIAAPVLADEPPAPPPIVGGFSEVAPGDPGLVAVARLVVPRLPRRNARLLKIEGGERQVVAGTNWRIALQLKDRTRWRAQVWHKLDGTYELTRFARVR